MDESMNPTLDLEGLQAVNVTFYVEGDDFAQATAHLTQVLSEAIGPLGPQCGIHVVILAASADAPAGGVRFSVN